MALAPHVKRGPGAECVRYTDRLLLSWRRAGARRVNSGFITMINPEIKIYLFTCLFLRLFFLLSSNLQV